ncbi:EI24 domain-containing protein [Demequina aurantiaca]|uniref:EI24 domain-containing protein n=1 Tax=Demequina aurantiaca TaxID=676200 RepID=UPI003D34F2E4
MTKSAGYVRRGLSKSGASGFFLGASYVLRGFRAWSRSPRLMGWGLLPGVVSVLLVATAVVVFSYNLGDAATWILERVASGVTGPLATVLWVVIAIGLIAGTLLIAVYSFTALTLLVGQPFFERISREVDAELGAPTAVAEESWVRGLLRGLAEAARLLALALLVASSLFILGLVPVVGTAVAFTTGAVFGGWLVTLELTSYSLSRRGTVTLRERRRQLASQRSVSAGFGVTVFLLFLLPLGAVATMPAATVGATLLTRRLLGEADRAGPPRLPESCAAQA